MTSYQERFTTPVETLQAEFQRNMDAVRNRRDLSTEARQVAIARAYAKARNGLRAAQQQDTETYTARRDRLERKLFGSTDDLNGSTAASRRDATDRATKLTNPDEAATAYNRARRDGDTDMLRAIAAHAAEQASHAASPDGWGQIVEHYASSRPALADAYQELTQLQQPGHGMDFRYTLPKPTEIGRLGDHQIDRLAATDLTIHGN